MARRVNYEKRGEKIKAMIDELIVDLGVDTSAPEVEEVSKKIKISDIDFEGEDIAVLMKIQGRLMRVIQNRIKG